jgi:protoporphyrin/coproporphyrin ferrochelatase
MTIRNSSSDGLILLAHGTPSVLGNMDLYLKLVTGGRGVPPEVGHELQERYAQIGLGDEPSAEGPHFTRWTQRQATLLEERLGKIVYVGMRNWEPFIGNVVEKMKRDGITRTKAICLRPQNSRTSIGLYKRAIENAAGNSMEVEFISGWADHPLLVKAFAHRMRVALNKARTPAVDKIAVLFTAHSVPSRTVLPSSKPVEYHRMFLANGPDSYADDCKLTAKLVASELQDSVSERDYHFSFQSQGMSGGPWLGPMVEDTLADLKHYGYDTVVIQPIGFLCDHVEILYDIDIAFQETAVRLDLTLIRAKSLNDSPLLIDALEDLALHGGRPKYALAG